MPDLKAARELMQALLRAFGLEGRPVERLVVVADARDVVRVYVKELPGAGPLRQVSRAFELASVAEAHVFGADVSVGHHAPTAHPSEGDPVEPGPSPVGRELKDWPAERERRAGEAGPGGAGA